MSLVRVWTDIGLEKNVSLVARIIHAEGEIFTIKFLSPTEEKDKHGRVIHRYEDETYEIDDDSITHYLETDLEEDIGLKQYDETGWIRVDEDSDEDYVPSESEEDEEEDEEEIEEEDDYSEEEEDYVDED
jgi:hypothetical protein